MYIKYIYTQEGHLPWFWVRTCGWSSRTHPIHILGQVKAWPIHILTIANMIHFTLYLLIYFLSKMIPHWYTFEVKSIPIHILRGLNSIPHSSRTSVYSYIMEVTQSPCIYMLYHFSSKRRVCRVSDRQQWIWVRWTSRGLWYVHHLCEERKFKDCLQRGEMSSPYVLEQPGTRVRQFVQCIMSKR